MVGTNTLAAEIHQTSRSSSDLTFDMRLRMTSVPAPPIVLTLDAENMSGGTVVLDFNAQAGVGYTVQNIDTLASTNWLVRAQVPPATTNRTVTVTNAPPLVPARFFRVVSPQIP